MTEQQVTKAQKQVLKAVIPQSDPAEVTPWRRGPAKWYRFALVLLDRLEEAIWSMATPTGLLALGVLTEWALGRVAWDPVVWAWGLHIGNSAARTVSQGAAAGMILRNGSGKVYPSPDEEDG